MPAICMITGSLEWHELPVAGYVRFTPTRLWVVENGIHWATLAPEVKLDCNGCFCVYVTPTDTDAVPWQYQVVAPGAVWYVSVSKERENYSLRELADEHRLKPRSKD